MESLNDTIKLFLAFFSVLLQVAQLDLKETKSHIALIDIISRIGQQQAGKISFVGGKERPMTGNGITVAKLDPDLNRLKDFAKFDSDTSSGVHKFKQYIKRLKNGEMVVGGNTGDISIGFEKDLKDSTFFKNKGLNFGNLSYKSSVAFIFQKGQPDKTLLVTDKAKKRKRSETFEKLVRFVVIRPFHDAPIESYRFFIAKNKHSRK